MRRRGRKGGRDVAQVNGRARPEADGSTLAQLLERDGFDAARVACEATVLRAGYVLEVVRFVGGG